jgi:signal transduction histidine kinase
MKYYKSFEKDLLLADYVVTNIFNGLKITLALQKISIKTRKELEQLISFEQQRYQQLKDTERLKEEYLSMISHELRTPLVPIKGYTEILLTNKMGPITEKQRKALQSIYRNIEKQDSLVSDILDVYRLDLDKINLRKKEVAVSDLFANVINDSQSLMGEKRIRIISKVNKKTLNTVFCDECRIEQVLLNLIKNSIDYVPEKDGEIVLSAYEENSFLSQSPYTINELDGSSNNNNTTTAYAVFTVKDNGPGIPTDKINNLFIKFYQIDSSDTRKHTGIGLGLSICKGIIEAHGGSIWAENNKDERGSTFGFKLPIKKDS